MTYGLDIVFFTVCEVDKEELSIDSGLVPWSILVSLYDAWLLHMSWIFAADSSSLDSSFYVPESSLLALACQLDK